MVLIDNWIICLLKISEAIWGLSVHIPGVSKMKTCPWLSTRGAPISNSARPSPFRSDTSPTDDPNSLSVERLAVNVPNEGTIFTCEATATSTFMKRRYMQPTLEPASSSP